MCINKFKNLLKSQALTDSAIIIIEKIGHSVRFFQVQNFVHHVHHQIYKTFIVHYNYEFQQKMKSFFTFPAGCLLRFFFQ